MGKINELLRLYTILPIAEFFNGTKISFWLRQIKAMNAWPKEMITDWQNKTLSDFVKHAYDHTVYYKRLFDDLCIKPEDIQTAEDLKRIPILTKQAIRQHFNELIPDNINSIPHRNRRTGGTTGEPMEYLVDENVWGYVTASKIINWKRIGYRYGDRFAALGSSSLFQMKPSFKRRVYDWIRQETPMNSMNMSDDVCALYLHQLKDKKIPYIYGYASSVYLLAKYSINNGLDTSFIKGVFTTSENLTKRYRDTIVSAFGCPVMDCYGALDAGITAFEYATERYGVGYNVIVETVDNSGDEAGKLLSTCILNKAFPLLRYDYGDRARLSLLNNDYNGVVITSLVGRESDYIQLDNGHILTSPGYTVLMSKFDIAAYSIKKIDGRTIRVSLKIIPEKWTNGQLSVLEEELLRFIGNDCSIVFDFPDEFESQNNGKRLFFLN